MRGTLIALATGGVALLGFGIWLGGQRASAEQPRGREPVDNAPATSVARATPGSPHAPVASLHATPSPAMPASTVKQALPGLEVDLRDEDARVRRNAVAELAASDAADAATLLAASHDPSLDVAVAATDGLGTLYRAGKISAADLVARASDPSAPAKLRVVAINNLGLVASPESATALADLLRSGDEYARRSAAILLVHQDPAVAVPALIGALRDADGNTRDNAREALRMLARGRDLGDDADAWQRWWSERSR
jgi:hypothetical protein